MSNATTADIIAFRDAEARGDTAARREARDLPEGHSADVLPLHSGGKRQRASVRNRGATPG